MKGYNSDERFNIHTFGNSIREEDAENEHRYADDFGSDDDNRESPQETMDDAELVGGTGGQSESDNAYDPRSSQELT